MKKFFTANITRTAIFVALLSIVPAMAIIAATGIERYTDAINAAEDQGERLVRTIAERQIQETEVMDTLAQVLVRLRDVRSQNASGASALFNSLAQKSPEYANIFLLDNDGSVMASGLPLPQNKNFSRYAFFKRTLRRGAFSVGTVVDSPFSSDPVLYFGMPAARDDGGPPCVLGVSMRLGRYNETLSGLVLPENASVYLLDGAGALAAAYPKAGPVPIGEMPGGEIWRRLQNQESDAGNYVVAGENGADRTHVTYRKLFLPGSDLPYFYVLYTRSEADTYANAKAILHRDFMTLGIVAFLSVAAAVALCAHAVRRPWNALLAAAMSMGQGNLDARVPEEGVGGEIGLLGKEFNTMAKMLEKRDKELSAARDYAELSRNAKSEFLANMSHEIRTSMNAILGMAYLVLKTELSAQQKGYVSKLLAAANALLRVINDILDFSKMEAGKLTMETIGFSLRRILSNVRSESASRLNEKKLGFRLTMEPEVPDHLIGDPLRLSQALMVLVDDAVTRSERGDVTLTCFVREKDEEHVVLAFAVRDAGVGLTPAQLAEVSDIFTQEGDETPSTMDKQRLRLAIANRLFRLMGGRVEVASVFGEGALFTAFARLGYSAGELRQHDRIFEGQRALIVDTSELACQDLVEILGRFGFSAECVPDLDTAGNMLVKAEEVGKPYSVVFADWRPSGADMPDQVARLRLVPGITVPPPIILTTAVGRAELPPSIEELDIDALLPKPINESLVFDTLMNILGAQPDSGYDADTRDEAGVSLSGVRVLLAEDNAVNQQIAGEILQSEGIDLTVAQNGEEAVRILMGNHPDAFDIVLMDLQMPKMDGFAATRAIRAKKEFHMLRLPIIAMTAHSDINEISACYAAGMNDYAAKPIVMDTFLATLRRWMPVKPDSAEFIASAVTSIRTMLAGNHLDPASLVALEDLLRDLVPHLHEGRVAAMKAVLVEGESMAVSAMLDALDGIVRDFLNPEDEP